jgi:hypothetical protein
MEDVYTIITLVLLQAAEKQARLFFSKDDSEQERK